MTTISNCTLSTACFCMHDLHAGARPLSETIDATTMLLKIPVYLVIYGDSKTIPLLRERRAAFGLESLSVFIETSMSDLWSFQYLEQVRKNRELYFPSRDSRTSPETHLVTCNKFSFVLQTMENNPFKTTRFGWIDAFLGKDSVKICENYEPNVLPWILSNISDDFHIQVLNVCDKKYKLEENKREYYSKYQWVVCGGFFTCGADVGRRILARLNDIFVETTVLGYGHGEEMFYLEVLDEFGDEIRRSYGDYGQMLDNFIVPKRNLHYIYYFILKSYSNMGYWKEAYRCSLSLINAMENYVAHDIPNMFVNIVIDHYISAYYCQPRCCIDIYAKITGEYMKNPLFVAEYAKEYYRIDGYIASIREVYGEAML